MSLCANCLKEMVIVEGLPFHADTRKLECTFRDREQQVNAQRMSADFQRHAIRLRNRMHALGRVK